MALMITWSSCVVPLPGGLRQTSRRNHARGFVQTITATNGRLDYPHAVYSSTGYGSARDAGTGTQTRRHQRLDIGCGDCEHPDLQSYGLTRSIGDATLGSGFAHRAQK